MGFVVILISQMLKPRFQKVCSLPGWKEVELGFKSKLWDPDIWVLRVPALLLTPPAPMFFGQGGKGMNQLLGHRGWDEANSAWVPRCSFLRDGEVRVGGRIQGLELNPIGGVPFSC